MRKDDPDVSNRSREFRTEDKFGCRGRNRIDRSINRFNSIACEVDAIEWSDRPQKGIDRLQRRDQSSFDRRNESAGPGDWIAGGSQVFGGEKVRLAAAVSSERSQQMSASRFGPADRER